LLQHRGWAGGGTCGRGGCEPGLAVGDGDQGFADSPSAMPTCRRPTAGWSRCCCPVARLMCLGAHHSYPSSPGCLSQVAVASGDRQLETQGQFQIGSVVAGELEPEGQAQQCGWSGWRGIDPDRQQAHLIHDLAGPGRRQAVRNTLVNSSCRSDGAWASARGSRRDSTELSSTNGVAAGTGVNPALAWQWPGGRPPAPRQPPAVAVA